MRDQLRTRDAALLLAVVAFSWGTSWPVTKLLLHYLPPLWTTASRSAVAAIALFGLAALRRRLVMPRRSDVPVLLNITLLHMVGFTALSNIGLQFVPVGRSVVLAYTTPMWVMIGARLFLGETLTAARAIGVVAGISGLLILFVSSNFAWSDHQALVGNGLVLLAALCWAASILHVRAHKWVSTPFELLPWLVLFATVVLAILAGLFEEVPSVAWDWRLALLLLYSGIIGVVLPYWATVVVNRSLPALATSLGLLGVPVIGVLCSSIALGETVSASLLAGMALIIGGIATGLLPGTGIRGQRRESNPSPPGFPAATTLRSPER
jgi:drug/metabolite transporter (DMT)-like permease